MKQIRCISSDVENIFPEYFMAIKPFQAKFSFYTYLYEVNDDNIVVYSFISDAIVVLNTQEFEKLKSMNFKIGDDLFRALRANGFFVHQETDELAVVLRYRDKISEAQSSTMKVVVLPTTECNAECNYCIGCNNIKATMTKDIADKAVSYIVKMAKQYSKIKYDWYGGEPLIKHDIIDYICSEIKQQLPKIEYSSVFTSNMALFNNKILNDSINNWHIQKINITIDGYESEHNLRKNYNNRKFNGYQHTMECIKTLLYNKIQVFCRFNVDKNNVLQLSSIIEDLKPFINDEKFYFFISPLRGNNAKNYFNINEYEDLFYTTGIMLNEKGIHNALDTFVPKLARSFCLAKSKNSVVIGPNGNLYRCNLCLLNDENSTGSVFEGLNKNNEYYKYVNKALDSYCCECKYLPICQGGCIERKGNNFTGYSQCNYFIFRIKAASRLIVKYYL